MAVNTSLSLVARRIAKVVKTYADKEGLARCDYALVGTFDRNSERISLTIGTTDHKIDPRQCYGVILQGIKEAFPEWSHLLMHIGLVVEHVENLDDIYAYFCLGDDEIDLTEMFERYLDKVDK